MSIDKLPGVNERKQKRLAESTSTVYDESMLRRLDKLEQDATGIKADVAVIKATHATKADVAEAKTGIVIWVVMAVVLAQLLPALTKLYFQ